MGVYGQVFEKQCPVPEDMSLKPLSFYGVTKLAAENYCNYFAAKGMKITSFRMFNVYGPGQNLDNMKQGMVSIYLKFIIDDRPIIVKGSKDRFRDFIYIDDVVEAWTKAIETDNTYGKVYNLGTGVRTTVSELLTFRILRLTSSAYLQTSVVSNAN
jgi:UDP-glucose 4-epimerase